MALEIKDRVPTRPNRVLITPEDGSAPFYGTITRADEPSQEGTPINKYLLDSMRKALNVEVSDEVYAVISKSNVDECLMQLAGKKTVIEGSYTGLKTTYTSDNPVSINITDAKYMFIYAHDESSITYRAAYQIFIPLNQLTTSKTQYRLGMPNGFPVDLYYIISSNGTKTLKMDSDNSDYFFYVNYSGYVYHYVLFY